MYFLGILFGLLEQDLYKSYALSDVLFVWFTCSCVWLFFRSSWTLFCHRIRPSTWSVLKVVQC